MARTTIRLEGSLLAEAKAEAARSGRTLTQVIEDALTEALSRRRHAPNRGSSLDLPTFPGKGLQPGVDLDSSASLLELMEQDAAG